MNEVVRSKTIFLSEEEQNEEKKNLKGAKKKEQRCSKTFQDPEVGTLRFFFYVIGSSKYRQSVSMGSFKSKQMKTTFIQ